MKTYAKLNNDGTLDVMPRPINVSNLDSPKGQEYLAALAAKGGYMEVVYTQAPHSYCSSSWEVVEGKITQVWTDWELERVREAKQAEIVAAASAYDAQLTAKYSSFERSLISASFTEEEIAAYAQDAGVTAAEMIAMIEHSQGDGKALALFGSMQQTYYNELSKAASSVAEIVAINPVYPITSQS